MENNFYEVKIIFNKNNYDLLYNKLYIEGVGSILEDKGEIKIYFHEIDREKVEDLKAILINENIINEKDFHVSNFESKDWNDEWMNTIEPIEIKEKILIYPSWKKNSLSNRDRILIEIDPKMSFGTGHNETTQLMLELMCDYIKGDENRFLDYGCGTGILTIAGIKLGVERIVAIDIDKDAIQNAQEYFRINGVENQTTLILSGIVDLKETGFDGIFANLIRGVIVDNFYQIKEKLNSKGKLFLSGILNEEKQIIVNLLSENDFEVVDIRDKAEWVGFYAFKK